MITCTTEHHAVLHVFEHLQKREGYRVTFLPVNRFGRVAPEQVAEAITPDTTLVSIMTANNETGTRQPVREIAAVCRARGVLFHTDAIQSFGKEPLPAGDFDAVRVWRQKEDERAEIWLATQLGGLPVRVLITERNGTTYEQVATRIFAP